MRPLPEDLRRQARDAYARGNFVLAQQLQSQLVDQRTDADEDITYDLNQLGLYQAAQGLHPQALESFRRASALDPHDPFVRYNIAVSLLRTQQFDPALQEIRHLLAVWPEDADVHSFLATLYTHMGRLDEAAALGRRALELRDKATYACTPPSCSVPPFQTENSERNVIAFSLWGTDPRYLDGAIRNAMLVPLIYEGWRARFYLAPDSQAQIGDALLEHRADIVPMPAPKRAYSGLFWRFLVADDLLIDRYLIRDADAVVSVRERVAVDDWIRSGKPFHLMRDSLTHSDLILAGLWGAVRGALPPLRPMIERYIAADAASRLPGRTLDQRFLREKVWPLIRHGYCGHDSVFGFHDACPFPPFGQRSPGLHVGQDDSVLRDRWKEMDSKKVMMNK